MDTYTLLVGITIGINVGVFVTLWTIDKGWILYKRRKK